MSNRTATRPDTHFVPHYTRTTTYGVDCLGDCKTTATITKILYRSYREMIYTRDVENIAQSKAVVQHLCGIAVTTCSQISRDVVRAPSPQRATNGRA